MDKDIHEIVEKVEAWHGRQTRDKEVSKTISNHNKDLARTLRRDFMFTDWRSVLDYVPSKSGQHPVLHRDGSVGIDFWHLDPETETWGWNDPNIIAFMEEQ